MWIKGTGYGAGFWYICWGLSGVTYNLDIYKTTTGLKKWLTNEAYKNVPVYRIGRIVITGAGVVEKEYWYTREDFLEWYLPKG